MRRSGNSAVPADRTGSGSADVFSKCRAFTRPREIQEAGLYPYFEVFGGRKGCGPGEVLMGDRKILMFGSNDYLDLIVHPKVMAAAADALHKYGTGCSGSRLLNGTLDLHLQVEADLAQLVHKEAAMIFGTGFQANYAALSTLTEAGDVLLCDHNLHASLVEGALRSPARLVRFRHNDTEHLQHCLENGSSGENALIVTEGVYSMEGDVADLPGIIQLAREHRARTYVDEAHSIGVFGETGAGMAEHLGVLDDTDIIMGTFSKSLASVGGFVAASHDVIEFLKHTARPFVFSASLPAASVAAAGAALSIIREEPERRQRLLQISQLLRSELCSRGLPVLDGYTPIVPVVIEDEPTLFRVCKQLMEEGIYVNPVLKPAASHNLLRISCTASHTQAHVSQLAEVLDRVVSGLGIPRETTA